MLAFVDVQACPGEDADELPTVVLVLLAPNYSWPLLSPSAATKGL